MHGEASARVQGALTHSMHADVGGTRLNFALAGSGERVVVLSHGLGSDLEYWAPLV